MDNSDDEGTLPARKTATRSRGQILAEMSFETRRYNGKMHLLFHEMAVLEEELANAAPAPEKPWPSFLVVGLPTSHNAEVLDRFGPRLSVKFFDARTDPKRTLDRHGTNDTHVIICCADHPNRDMIESWERVLPNETRSHQVSATAKSVGDTIHSVIRKD